MNILKDVTKNTNGTKVSPISTNAVNTQLSEKESQSKTIPPLEERLHRLNVLFDLQKRFNKLSETKLKLQKFEVAHNKENSELLLTDDDGNEFKTTNPEVIQEVKTIVLNIISKKEAEVAEKLNW
jgi:hypothetical protein